MDSLLVSLRKYRPRENSDPLENFVTEAFAWLLRSSSEISDSLFNLINENLDVPLAQPESVITISTQENFSGKFPDMVMKWDGIVIVFEHKVWAELHENQLSSYRNYIKDNSIDNRIILITANVSQHGQNPDAAFCWEDVYNTLSSLSKRIENEKQKWHINDFLELLKSEGLGPSLPINPLSILHYPQAIKLESQLNALVEKSKGCEWGFKSEYDFLYPKKRYGRLGFEMCYRLPNKKNIWLPGLFCGFLLDDYDHDAEDIMKDGIKAVVVLDINITAYNSYLNSSNYQSLIKDILETESSELIGWSISDRTTEKGVKLNKWHPLIISMPMENFFRGSSTLDEQVDAFYKQITNVIDVILSRPNFPLFQNEMLNYIALAENGSKEST